MNKTENSRRRGDELLESLYNATMKLATTTKLTNLTFQQIADEARTSRTVLYRRWSTPFDLLQDIYSYKAKKLFDGAFFDELKDNGSLRKDLLQLLTVYQKVHTEIGAEIINNYYFLRAQDKNDNNELLIHKQAVEKHLNATKKILANAEKRGEKIRKISPITLMLPYDLIRTENLIRPTNISKKRLTMMVDEILMPVFVG
ncbi:transcriptional regulator, TetR family [Chitinophaga terrae (ex Kim and Jung 2007)]|uniref:Transcriptional regulator, TetR family n=1 Tax=Chitinophaga terrae (ex Kim and Jung 2007) TaxID=408074 RepID=A0A1H4ELS4_9BACT|nr:TetR/AcrR family transcriptional regulator [Chitinophaga terrae (ex Kim and Jung 2007)]GEP91686.1 TetR family transcriptional regulator [Chitinophaga terrae (ex Kim and Jung 2007)]SEA85500.1 transcriptional regulator, TetR family [Chitinophaga terrae (ex Kim and Jung 2007)]